MKTKLLILCLMTTACVEASLDADATTSYHASLNEFTKTQSSVQKTDSLTVLVKTWSLDPNTAKLFRNADATAIHNDHVNALSYHVTLDSIDVKCDTSMTGISRISFMLNTPTVVVALASATLDSNPSSSLSLDIDYPELEALKENFEEPGANVKLFLTLDPAKIAITQADATVKISFDANANLAL